ncbi:type IV toxin-antitoxin system AbiEi family antitoxin domain-containing protein [Gordonia jinhuaensis]|nr:hypothetical protein [Gordonia jinhuaensis]
MGVTLSISGLPADQFGLIRRDAALAHDVSDKQLAAAVRRGELIRLVPGVFVADPGRFAGHGGRDELYRLRCVAVATSESAGGFPLSHASAAAVHGLGTLKPDRDRVHVTNGRSSGGSIRTYRHIHSGALHTEDVTVIDQIAVTSLERTAVDVAVTGDFAQALTVFDAALRHGADRDLMSDLLAAGRRTGIRAARRAIALADGLSESVGESWSRAQMIDAGLPIPRLQSMFRSRSEYRCDFEWERRLIGEFDGVHKYGRLLRPGETPADAVVREKVREDELRAMGLMVVRWTWATLERGEMVPLLRAWMARLGIAG